MEGRLEHELQIKETISNLLSSMPDYVSDFYYKIQVSNEPTTCLQYIRIINRFLLYIKKDARDVTSDDIGKYFNEINFTKDRSGSIKKTTSSYKRNVWAALNNFFSYLKGKGDIDENPMKNIGKPKYSDKVEKKPLSISDLNDMLNAVKTGAGSDLAIKRQEKWKERDMLILALFMNTGMRNTALSEINVSDFSFEKKSLTIRDKRNKIEEYDLTYEMEKLLRSWLKKRDMILDGKKVDALFISAKRNRLAPRSIFDIINKYSEEALSYKISPHKLRGSFISIYYKASGYDIEATRKAVGHSSVATTSRYITQENKPRKEAVQYMSRNLKY